MNGACGMTPEVVLWPVHKCMHALTHTYTHTEWEGGGREYNLLCSVPSAPSSDPSDQRKLYLTK